MKTRTTPLAGLLVLEPKVFEDERGFFFESFNVDAFADATGVVPHFVQDNHSRSSKGVLRGLHYQIQRAQGKLVRIVAGSVLDVAVDLRRSSPTFGQWYAIELSAANRLQLWIPAGFAHGFTVLSEAAEMLYKATDFWMPEHERTILWSDPALAITWPEGLEFTISAKDRAGLPFADSEFYA